MKIYAPNKLIQVVSKIEEQFPLTAKIQPDISSEALKKLVLEINGRKHEELPAFAVTVTKQERQSLCRYMRTNSYHVDLSKIAIVISERMDRTCFSLLYNSWEFAPDCIEALKILGQFDNEKYRPMDFKLDVGLLTKWANASNPLAAVVRNLSEMNSNKKISDILQEYFTPGRPIIWDCENIFFTTATLGQFHFEGDIKVKEILDRVSNKERERIILRLLKVAMNYRLELNKFPKVYSVAEKLWKKPDSGLFPRNEDELKNVYRWWYNYNTAKTVIGNDMVNGKADPRRMLFWQKYFGLCECHHNVKHDMLIMDFGDYVATEFKIYPGPAYIFVYSFYVGPVKHNMVQLSTSKLKGWIFNEWKNNNSGIPSREIHNASWEYNQTWALKKCGISL